jgi:hypothetical protein
VVSETEEVQKKTTVVKQQLGTHNLKFL